MATLQAVTVASLAQEVGIPYERAAIAVSIAYAESGLRTDAVGYNGPTPGCPNGSRDRGLWQINDCYHPSVSDECAFDPHCNARAMAAISGKGVDWGPWSTYGNGAYLRYMTAAAIAVNLVYIVGAIPAEIPGAVDPVWYTIKYINDGGSPIHAVAYLLQSIMDGVMDAKYGPGNRTGPIMGGLIQ